MSISTSMDYSSIRLYKLCAILHICIATNRGIGLTGRVFANGPGDRGSIAKTQNMVLYAALFNTRHYKVRVKWNGVTPFPIPRCSSNWKRSLRVTLDLGRQLHFFTYIATTIAYIYIFTNLISTSIHGTRKKKKKTPGTRDNSISNHRPGEKEKNIIGQKERKGQPRQTPWKKIKRYAVSWSKEN